MSETRHQAATTSVGPVGHFFDDVVTKTRFWWLLLITGAAWIVLSIVILRFDYATVEAVAVLFGVYCLVAAVKEIMIAAVSSSTGWRIAHGVLAVLLVGVGCGVPGELRRHLRHAGRHHQLLLHLPRLLRYRHGLRRQRRGRVVGAVDLRAHRAGVGVLGCRVMEHVRGGLGGVGGRRSAGARHRRNRPGLPDPPRTPRHHRHERAGRPTRGHQQPPRTRRSRAQLDNPPASRREWSCKASNVSTDGGFCAHAAAIRWCVASTGSNC